MIKNFDDFFNNQRIVESSLPKSESPYEDVDNGIAFDSKDLEDAKNFTEPRMVADDKYLAKISMIVIKHLRKRVSSPFMVYPFILSVDGKDCAMIMSQTSSLVLYKNGIEKTIAYFKGNPLDGVNQSEFSVSTRKFGFLAMIRSLVNLIVGQEDGAVNEARSTPEITPATKPSYAAYTTICKKCNDTTAIPKDAMHEFLKLYELYDDAEIKSMMCADPEDLPEALRIVQKGLCTKKDGITIDPTAAYRAIQVVHMILCGVTYGCDDKEANALKETWFWGAGKAGKLAIEYSDATGYVIKEAEDIMEGRVNALEEKMQSVYDAAVSVCKYIKSGGKDMSMRGEIAKHRGILITGVAGIGKSVSLNKAIKDVGLIENVDYKKMGNATTGAREVYHELYEGNNMLLIYDDTPEMFNAEGKISLWKLAMEADEGGRMVMNPDGEAKKNSTVFYDAADPTMTRQDRYLKEIGKFTHYEKKMWIKKEIKKINAEYSSKKEPVSKESIKIMAEKRFEEYEENEATSLIPDRFIFNGIIVYISNQTLSSFEKSAKDHWDAIFRRMEVIDISPTQKVIWAWLRKKILADAADDSKPDDLKIFPTKSSIDDYSIDAAVEHIDSIMEGKYNDETTTYGQINFGTISNMREYIIWGNPKWKQKFLDNMKISAARVR